MITAAKRSDKNDDTKKRDIPKKIERKRERIK
jgi:hypothetical protein